MHSATLPQIDFSRTLWLEMERKTANIIMHFFITHGWRYHYQIIRFTVLSGAEHLEIWIPVVCGDGLNLSTDAEKFASCQSVAPVDGLDVSVNATKLAVWKSVVLGDDRNLGVSAKELVRWKLVSTEAGLTFSVDTVAVSSWKPASAVDGLNFGVVVLELTAPAAQIVMTKNKDKNISEQS